MLQFQQEKLIQVVDKKIEYFLGVLAVNQNLNRQDAKNAKIRHPSL